MGNYRIQSLDAREREREGRAGAGRPVDQMDLLAKLEERAEARNNGRPGRA